jgi:hypothetical protein
VNAEFNCALEIVVADAGATVQYQRDCRLLANGVQTREVEQRFAFIFAVGIANGDRQRVNPGSVNEITRQHWVGKQ